MTREEFQSDKLTDEQRESFRNLQKDSGIDFDDLLERSYAPGGDLFPYVSIHNFHGMFVGIEPDGYTHT